jgi:hypothetical protein
MLAKDSNLVTHTTASSLGDLSLSVQVQPEWNCKPKSTADDCNPAKPSRSHSNLTNRSEAGRSWLKPRHQQRGILLAQQQISEGLPQDDTENGANSTNQVEKTAPQAQTPALGSMETATLTQRYRVRLPSPDPDTEADMGTRHTKCRPSLSFSQDRERESKRRGRGDLVQNAHTTDHDSRRRIAPGPSQRLQEVRNYLQGQQFSRSWAGMGGLRNSGPVAHHNFLEMP